MRIKRGKKVKIEIKNTDSLIPYANNPRQNDKAVKYVAESIKQFGIKVPVVIDSNNVIVAGHTRLKACEQLGITEIPCIVADDLSEEQIKAFRLADNKVAEFSQWDIQGLNLEIEGLDFDMKDFGFLDNLAIDWDDVAELTEETYEEPEKPKLQCPNCEYKGLKKEFQ